MNAINTNAVKVADLKVDYIMKNGIQIMANTRTTAALTKAGVPRSLWNGVNRTGNLGAEGRIAQQLFNNKLSDHGSFFIAPRGK